MISEETGRTRTDPPGSTRVSHFNYHKSESDGRGESVQTERVVDDKAMREHVKGKRGEILGRRNRRKGRSVGRATYGDCCHMVQKKKGKKCTETIKPGDCKKRKKI